LRTTGFAGESYLELEQDPRNSPAEEGRARDPQESITTRGWESVRKNWAMPAWFFQNITGPINTQETARSRREKKRDSERGERARRGGARGHGGAATGEEKGGQGPQLTIESVEVWERCQGSSGGPRKTTSQPKRSSKNTGRDKIIIAKAYTSGSTTGAALTGELRRVARLRGERAADSGQRKKVLTRRGPGL